MEVTSRRGKEENEITFNFSKHWGGIRGQNEEVVKLHLFKGVEEKNIGIGFVRMITLGAW